jgi:hypothetical protein
VTHELKIWPHFYEPVSQGKKTFEVRNNDRGFNAGDTVILKEWDPSGSYEERHHPTFMGSVVHGKYTGSPDLKFIVGYVLPIDGDRVVFSLVKNELPY